MKELIQITKLAKNIYLKNKLYICKIIRSIKVGDKIFLKGGHFVRYLLELKQELKIINLNKK